MGSMAGKDAQVLRVTLPPRSFPFCTSSRMAGAAADGGVAGGAGIEVTACGFSSTMHPCEVMNGVHLGPEPL